VSKVKLGVIGAGWWGAEVLIPTLARREDVALDGVSRLGAAELARVKDHFGFAFASEDFRAVLARKPEAVIVSSPHALHYAHAKAALEAGAHVLVEKPMTLDAREAWDLAVLAARQRRELLVSNGYHYLPGIAALQKRLAQGAVGTIEHVTCHFATPTRDVFAGDKGLSSWQTAFFRPDKSTWQDPDQGGGFAYGQLSHSLAMMFWMTELDAETVAARRAPGKVDLCDAATVTFSSGAIGMVGGSAAVPQGGRQQLRLFVGGSAGSFTLDVDLDRAELLRHDGANETTTRAPGDWVYRCDGPVDRLVELAQGRGENWSPGVVGAKTVALIEAIHRSAEAGGAPVAVTR
jgi:predicted dehydrogenase